MIVRTLSKVNRPWPDAEREMAAREAVVRRELEQTHGLSAATVQAIEDLRERPVLGSLPATIKSFAVDIVAAGILLTAGLWLAAPRNRRGRLAAGGLAGAASTGVARRLGKGGEKDKGALQ